MFKIQNKKFRSLEFRILNLFRISDFEFRIYQHGFTLIELILYIALVSIFITGAIFFAWDVVYGREKAYQQQIVEQNARIAMARIAYEIRRAENIQSVDSNQIILDNAGSTTTINLSDNQIHITTGGAGPYNLTSNEVNATDLTFTNLSSSNNNTKNIGVNLAVEQSSSILSGQTKAKTIVNESVELNSQFNQARSLLVDASSAILSQGNKRVEGITLTNSSLSDIVIDKITVSWTGGTSGSVLQSILINDNTVWSGTGNFGDTLDITNTTLTPTDNFSNVFNFSKKMADSTINISYLLLDRSVNKIILTFAPEPTTSLTPTVGPSPTPTIGPTQTPVPPSPTPVPPTATPTPVNCNQYCQYKYGLPGSCKKSNQCIGYDEGRIYECSSPNICCCQ